jgi:hypothetical protein
LVADDELMLQHFQFLAEIRKDPDLIHAFMYGSIVFVFRNVDDPENRHVQT